MIILFLKKNEIRLYSQGMNINYYTLCYDIILIIFKYIFKNFFSKKPKNFNKFNHNVFLYTDKIKSNLKKK